MRSGKIVLRLCTIGSHQPVGAGSATPLQSLCSPEIHLEYPWGHSLMGPYSSKKKKKKIYPSNKCNAIKKSSSVYSNKVIPSQTSHLFFTILPRLQLCVPCQSARLSSWRESLLTVPMYHNQIRSGVLINAVASPIHIKGIHLSGHSRSTDLEPKFKDCRNLVVS